jgi:hypothetical protein
MATKAASYDNKVHIKGCCGSIEVGHPYIDEERDILSS